MLWYYSPVRPLFLSLQPGSMFQFKLCLLITILSKEKKKFVALNVKTLVVTEESTVMLEGQGGNHARSLTLEEATDTILFCSSIVHNMVYEAANIAIEKENSVQLEGSRPVVTPVGKSNLDRRDSRARTVSKQNTKSQKARQRRLETDSKPPSGNTATNEKGDVSTTRIVGTPNKGDSMKPPKLESKCNCAIM